MSKLIKIDDFAEKHEVDSMGIYAKRSINALPSSIFHQEGNNSMFIDEEYFIKRKRFKRKVWLNSHDNYYFLSKHLRTFHIATLLHKIDSSVAVSTWNTFMSQTLFAIQSESIYAYNIHGLALKFYRYTRWLIRGAFLITEVKPENRDIEVLFNYTKKRWSVKKGRYIEVR